MNAIDFLYIANQAKFTLGAILKTIGKFLKTRLNFQENKGVLSVLAAG